MAGTDPRIKSAGYGPAMTNARQSTNLSLRRSGGSSLTTS